MEFFLPSMLCQSCPDTSTWPKIILQTCIPWNCLVWKKLENIMEKTLSNSRMLLRFLWTLCRRYIFYLTNKTHTNTMEVIFCVNCKGVSLLMRVLFWIKEWESIKTCINMSSMGLFSLNKHFLLKNTTMSH